MSACVLQTPLHWACHNGHHDVVRLFLKESDIKTNIKDTSEKRLNALSRAIIINNRHGMLVVCTTNFLFYDQADFLLQGMCEGLHWICMWMGLVWSHEHQYRTFGWGQWPIRVLCQSDANETSNQTISWPRKTCSWQMFDNQPCNPWWIEKRDILQTCHAWSWGFHNCPEVWSQLRIRIWYTFNLSPHLGMTLLMTVLW